MAQRAEALLKRIVAYLTAGLRITPVWPACLAVVLLLAGAGCSPTRLPVPPTTDEAQATPTLKASATPRPLRTSAVPTLPAPTPTRAILVQPGALKGQVVQFWHPYTREAQVLLDLMTLEFNRTNRWGIRVENTAMPGFTLLDERLRQAVQDETLPDLWPMATYQALLFDANGEVIADLQPYLADGEYGLTAAQQADFLPSLWSQDQVAPPALKGRSSPQGKRLGLPWVRTGVLLVYNQSWGRELGFSGPPQSITGFRDQASAAA